MNTKPAEKERLQHIIEAIDRILKFTDGMTVAAFYENEMAQFAVIKNFEIIGEASYRLSRELCDNHSEVEWKKIMAFRHILVHDYCKIDLEVVWRAIQNKITDLKVQIEQIIESMPSD